MDVRSLAAELQVKDLKRQQKAPVLKALRLVAARP